MMRVLNRSVLLVIVASTASAQNTNRPLAPIDSLAGAITVNVANFASIPDIGGSAARLMTMIDETGTRRFFVSDMRGPIYSVSYDGRTVRQYVDVNDGRWGVDVNSQGRERGVQSFAFHPQFAQQGTPGYGKFYTWSDSRNNQATAEFQPGGGSNSHHTVLHEWTARNATADAYDGAAPRELMRFEQPFSNHNGGHVGFNPTARPGTPDFGLLYIGSADGGSGGDPLNLSQNMASGFGKVLRIDPMGRNSRNGKYGIPASNPFVNTQGALGEIYALGVRNPQRIGWDPSNGRAYLADIGQNTVEEISPMPAGGNLGWNMWEGSFRYGGRGGVDTSNARGDSRMVYPTVEYMHADPLMPGRHAATGVVVVRSGAVPALRNKVLFGDNPSGEVFWFDADQVPNGRSSGIHRVLFGAGGGTPTTLLQLIRQQNAEQGKAQASRADLRFGEGADGRVFLLNKADGTIRVIVP